MTGSRIRAALPVLLSTDLDRTEDYYTSKLGMRRSARYMTYLVLERDDIELHFRYAASHRPPEHSLCRWLTDDVEALHDEFNQRGARIVEDLRALPSGALGFVLADPDDNRIEISALPRELASLGRRR